VVIFPEPHLQAILNEKGTKAKEKKFFVALDRPKNVNHLVSKEHVIMLLKRYVSFLEWFAKSRP
jgi:hypothetical protein